MKHLWSLLLIAGFIMTLAFSCDKRNEVIVPADSPSPVVEVYAPSTVMLGQSISFNVRHQVFNGCGRYSRNEVTESGKTWHITFYGKYPSTGACTDIIATLETPFQFTPTQTGQYILKFKQGDQYIDTIIQVN
ncbi:MAG: hypothetical protein HOP08_02520 [Cyclobacteriaceae bacterium]|nr:hypothetical protein [Cyclobacteriaceae bacterium]